MPESTKFLWTVTQSKYLPTTPTNANYVIEEIKSKFGSVDAFCRLVRSIWSSCLLSKNTKARIPSGVRDFAYPETSRPASGPTQLPIQLVPEFFPGVKLPELEVDHLHLLPSFRMSGAVPLLPLYTLMAWKETTV
jgi:hypothetical protein